MYDDEIYEIISAFVLGCLDNENYLRFKNYNDKNGKLPLKEFGEFQNIIALIPTLLDISKPSPKLKAAVAKNILSYQEEIKEKIRAKKTATISAVKPETKSSDIKDTKQTKNKLKTKNESTGNYEEKLNKEPEKESKKAGGESKYEKDRNKKLLTIETNAEKQGAILSRTEKLPWIIFGIVLILTIIGSIYFYLNNNNLKHKILKLNREVILLKAEIRKEADYINTNKKIVDFLNYGELSVVNLQKRDNSLNASGKLLISFEKKEALLDAENLPPLPKGKVFQLWLITKDISYPLLKFIPSNGSKYYTMPKLPYVPKSNVDLIRITVEPDSGSEYPTGNTILFGGFAK